MATPHTCPTCNGTKNAGCALLTGEYGVTECKTCDGTGIVWERHEVVSPVIQYGTHAV